MSISFSNWKPREGWSEAGPGVSMPDEALADAPTVVWKHIDGPLLCWACYIHWLTWRERFLIWIGRETVESVAQKHWPLRKRWASSSTHQTAQVRG